MNWLQKHLRNTLLAGIFAAIPIAVTAFVIYYLDHQTRALVAPWPRLSKIPFIGVVVAILVIYAVGVIVTSIIGKWIIRRIDALLSRVPVLRDLYKAWKHISITPGGKEGIFAKAVLVPADDSGNLILGFTSGDPLEGNPNLACVFVPAAPNPINGRLLLVPIAKCIALPISTEEAFKLILSTGNYIPPEVGIATGKTDRALQ